MCILYFKFIQHMNIHIILSINKLNYIIIIIIFINIIYLKKISNSKKGEFRDPEVGEFELVG